MFIIPGEREQANPCEDNLGGGFYPGKESACISRLVVPSITSNDEVAVSHG